MYRNFFGLKAHPFKNTPTAKAFYGGADRAEILAALMHLLERNDAFIKLTGEVGTGKTTLLHNLINRLLEAHRYQLVYFPSPKLTPEAMLKHLCSELGIHPPPNADKADLYQAIYRHIIAQFSQNRQIVIIVDEAHLMPIETLEELRLLSNIETQEKKLIQIILAGQPELDKLLQTPQARALSSRITHSLCLTPATDEDIHAYLNHRMVKAGYNGDPVFPLKTARKINKLAKGSLRIVNNLADSGLMVAYLKKRNQVLPQDIHASNRKPWIGITLIFVLSIPAILIYTNNKNIVHKQPKWDNYVYVSKTPQSCEQKPPLKPDGFLTYRQAGKKQCIYIYADKNASLKEKKEYVKLSPKTLNTLTHQRHGSLVWSIQK